MNENSKNILTATILSAMILISWTWFYEKPRAEKQAAAQKVSAKIQNDSQKIDYAELGDQNQPKAIQENRQRLSSSISPTPRKDIIKNSKNYRLKIDTPELNGSINLKGALFDDLTLANYQQELNKKSNEVVLLSPEGGPNQYWVGFEWLSDSKNIELPDSNTIWKTNTKVLTPDSPATLYWKNKQNILFQINVAVDKNFMFSVSQTVQNQSSQDLELAMGAKIYRFLSEISPSSYISHEGPIAVSDGILTEINFENLKDEQINQTLKVQTGWLGVTDKYWLVSIIPDKKIAYSANFSYQENRRGYEKMQYNVNYISNKFRVKSGSSITFDNLLFSGAKKVSLLDSYSEKYDIKIFDRAVDFGWYYFLTKPFFYILHFFNSIFGNYGLAILSITVLIKLLMFPLANKSYLAIAKIKKLQPKIEKIREEYKGKKMQMNKEIMELYKREKVNPVSGCLPMLVQIPVFFSLYKVLYLTIDMRHTPFYGWVKDLSAPDPTSIFNLFGLLPFEVHSFFLIGIWPILMGLTMIVQQKLNPQPSDPAQAKVMKLLPFIMIIAFAHFPAGLVIYWTWSNVLSILQQWFITKKLNKS
jgi:YidC/Oxa1 family membrane protein insertase